MSPPRILWHDGTPYRVTPLPAAQTEILSLIRAQPGLSMSDLARARHTSPTAAQKTVLTLERLGLIRTERAEAGEKAPRRCYPVEPS